MRQHSLHILNTFSQIRQWLRREDAATVFYPPNPNRTHLTRKPHLTRSPWWDRILQSGNSVSCKV